MKKLSLGFFIVFILFFVSCATMRNTRTVGAERAPHYRGNEVFLAKVGHFPAVLQPRMNSFMHSDRKEALQPLLEAMNQYLEELAWTEPISYTGFPKHSEPEITVGIEDDEFHPRDEKEKPRMVLNEMGPTKAWTEVMIAKAREAGVDGVLWISIGVNDYLPRQKDILGQKEVELGTGYILPVPWLTDLETPVEVLQVSGALFGADGKILRSGAEGIIGKRTGFIASLFSLQETITEKEMNVLIHEIRREDLKGSPLAWQAALHNLIAQLLSDSDRAMLPWRK